MIDIKHGKDGRILYDESTNRWIAYANDNKVSERQSLKDARRALDELDNKAKEFSRHPVLLSTSYGHNVELLIPAEVTSYCDDGDVWVKVTREAAEGTRFTPGRRKVSYSMLYEFTKDNLELARALKLRREQAHAFHEQTLALSAHLVAYKRRS